eukprot:3816644-Lingulodinium_polyedra.AAC.1
MQQQGAAIGSCGQTDPCCAVCDNNHGVEPKKRLATRELHTGLLYARVLCAVLLHAHCTWLRLQ